ncbi:Eco57I restriction-modification methylase domain-containing protein [Myroides marinus]|uniref:type IIG restriction enzyme/methyltransferase n=1 Tax=Myroides marinus TaxID=703342 RepID=UPI0025777FDA|nr:TaqI-like C-terminal specificity domain-containing protein [Myroides marinus]MDM1503016.1 Eco57I restriction-modification methylase domain-containing protein [Myroides marinus]
MQSLSVNKVLNPAYRKFKPKNEEIEVFKKELLSCIEAIELSDQKNESEEHLKEPIKRFFQSTFYQKNLINTKDKIDLAVYLDETAKSDVGIIIEAKRPSNKTEFLSENNLNKKALQELLLYYLRERIDCKNNNIKHLIVTNGIEWFFFKAEDFYKLFYKNSALVKEYENFRDGLKDTSKNELFYNEIASKYIKEIHEDIPFVYVKLTINEIESYSESKLITLYKLFSSTHLLGHSFGNDSNKLNDSFYKELLHIIGLEETKENSKKVITRKEPKHRDYASLLENAIFTLEDKDYLSRVNGFDNEEDKAFSVGLELCITWINRILFLKLLESQLVSYNKSEDFRFLNFTFLNGFDALNDLFFSALAKPLEDRHAKYKDKFKHIPYLNSSLFEHSDIEKKTFDITALKDEEMEVYPSSVLKDATGKRLKGKLGTLEYIFKFLDAYDFSADANTLVEEGGHETKTLINASVLGLIFEKINGYKDGSFYTPGTITMFMCKETIRKAVVDRFKSEYHQDINSFEDVKDYCAQFFKKEDILKFNETINKLKICDPAVGSGHFLVSALNEVIAIKSELGILSTEEGKRIPCEVTIENDELYISYSEGELFEYQRQDTNSLLIQKTLFHEKQIVIENCLFGVDINPNSVNICRLRLWIELLKNAYYTSEGELQTLPNIDINIKCGNSLISRFSLNDSLKDAFKNKEVSYKISDYKTAVDEYKQTNSKEKKREVLDIISTIKSNFKSTLDSKSKEKVSKAIGEYENEKQRLDNIELFGEKLKKAEKDNLKKLKVKADKLQQEKDEILNNIIYKDAFEWRFEFPEVLDSKGEYVGFDVIIGNPPYIRIQGIRSISTLLADTYISKYKSATGSFDIYSLFAEIGIQLIKEKGIVNYIMPVKWTNAAFGAGLRGVLLNESAVSKIINFGAFQAFEASTYTGLQWFEKKSEKLFYHEVTKDYKNLNELDTFLNSLVDSKATVIPLNKLGNGVWTLTESNVSSIIDKLNLQPRRISDVFDKIFQGLATSKDDVYFLYNCSYEDNFVKGFSKQLNKEVWVEIGLTKPLLKGEDVHRYETISTNRVVIFPYKLIDNKSVLYEEKELENTFPKGYEYLKECEDILRDREKGRFNIDGEWFKFGRKQGIDYAESEKLVAPEISLGGNFSYDVKGQYYSTTTIYGYVKKKETTTSYKTLMAILNSQIMWWYLVNTGTILSNGYFRFKPNYLNAFPLPNITSKDEEILESLVNKVIDFKKENRTEVTKQIEQEIDNYILNMYNLTKEEKSLIFSL